eukprot:1328964-Amorphochlora_amoeboformis.AAC.1
MEGTAKAGFPHKLIGTSTGPKEKELGRLKSLSIGRNGSYYQLTLLVFLSLNLYISPPFFLRNPWVPGCLGSGPFLAY